MTTKVAQSTGGQSIPLFDYYLAPYVALTYVKTVAKVARIKLDLENSQYEQLKEILVDFWNKAEKHLVMDKANLSLIEDKLINFLTTNNIEYSDKKIERLFKDTYTQVYDETFQAMEAFIHNLNTMHCLPESEKIWVFDVKTNNFYLITMGELYKNFENNRFKVISLNTNTGKAEFKFISHCKKLDNNRTLVEIQNKQGQKVRVTDNHNIMTVNSDLDITEKLPKDLKYTLSPRGIKFPVVKYDLCVSDYGKPRAYDAFQNDHILINEEFAEFIGYYVANGYMLDDTSTCCISNCERLTFEYMEDLLTKAFGCKLNTSYNTSKNNNFEKDINIELGIPLERLISDKFGRVYEEKKIPIELMFAPDDIKLAFLKAYFKLNKKRDEEYKVVSTANKNLQLQLALMIFSLKGSVHYNGVDCNKDKINTYNISLGSRDSYNLGIVDSLNTKLDIPDYDMSMISKKYAKEYNKFNKKGLLRYDELDELINSYGHSELEKFNNIFINEVVEKVESNSKEEYVYDISVEDNENFLTSECIFVHNSRAGRIIHGINVPVTWETLCPAV